MKFTKFMVLAAGVLAIASFFLPLVATRVEGHYIHVSGFQIVKGIDSAKDVVTNVGNEADTAEVKASVAEANDSLDKVKGIIWMVFGPGFLLLPLGIAAVVRKKFQRLGGVGALLLGVIAAGFGAIMLSAANETAAQGEAGPGPGIYAMILGGVLGMVAGVLALIKPDRG